jgi:hypothetical protein
VVGIDRSPTINRHDQQHHQRLSPNHYLHTNVRHVCGMTRIMKD